MRPVLIISSINEPCTDFVSRELEGFGASVLRINYENSVKDFFWSGAISDALGGSISIRSKEVAEFRPQSIWMRRWGYPLYPANFDELSVSFSFGEISSLISGLPNLTHDCFWINDIRNEQRASNKITQLSMALACKFTIPRTIFTNDPDHVREFNSAVGTIIFKPISASQMPIHRFNKSAFNAIEPDERERFQYGKNYSSDLLYTQILTAEKFEQIASLRWSPAIFQELIEKQYDIRVTVVGNEIFACIIESQSREDTKVDFRVMNQSGILPHKVAYLPDDINRKILDLMGRLGLYFGCIDLIQDKNGNYIFLEINPSGQWLWVEQVTGLPISRSIARALAGNDQ
jgi:hypothetical protein